MLARKRARWFRSARVLHGLEVGDGSDKWTPLAVTRGRGTTLSAAEARKEEARGCWACAEWAACWRWAAARKKWGERKTFSIF